MFDSIVAEGGLNAAKSDQNLLTIVGLKEPLHAKYFMNERPN
jgi:hypothetical protein